MSMKEWMDLDMDELELMDVSELEKERVKQHVLKTRKKAPVWRKVAAAAIILVGAGAATSVAMPSVASQIPFMDDVISYFNGEDNKNFDTFSTDIGLAETSNGVTVMIDNAVYDGTNITVSFAIETEEDFGEAMHITGPNWFEVEGSVGSRGTNEITKISDTRYVGLFTFTPQFKEDEHPDKVDVSWTPQAFSNYESGKEVEGDWSFDFSLERVKGEQKLLNETVQNKDITFTLKSIEFTDVSTVIGYEQMVKDEFLEKWPSVTPVFRVTDDLGNVYMDGTGGGGMSKDNGKTFSGTTQFGTIEEGASQLIIEPIAIASLMSGEGLEEFELEPIVIELE
ncbi:DUF4179 domain-containing protein [Rossellomorea aquimaris]|uniref:DUF4179 domain-containing protein n=1 Tax=Rossellomorea aquimaris TaxID=189382 RepID=UPI001CD1F803|nr:DUF4179 domain-containing protein [Rossellomorea aquimaris]MCA1054347.1 DUF4179 domain-containing protein [Rossellomorea aquimaris]